jgi:glycosyltransferase involved in cell wall biosynthesis
MSDAPRVSVILPSYNRLAHLRGSIGSALAQTMTDLEVIIADDGSDADTRAALRSLDDPRIRVLALAHTGLPAAARNAAIRAARGRWVAFLDSDDLWLPGKLARQLEYLEAHPGFAWSYHACGRIDAAGGEASSDGVKPFAALDGDITRALLDFDALVATPTVMARRDLVVHLGGFDEAQRFGEDYDLWIRLALASPAGVLGEPLALVRVHDDNVSQDRIGAHRGWVRLYGKMLALVPTALRRTCRRRRAQARLDLARALWGARRRGAALGALTLALATGWRYARWWRDVASLVSRHR